MTGTKTLVAAALAWLAALIMKGDPPCTPGRTR